jgi:prepilin-type processing-associated H-X9-DG protein
MNATPPAPPDVIPYSPKGASPKAARWIIRGIIISVGLLLILSLLTPSLCRSRETANRVKCASNLRQIGQAILTYANDHQGAYPGSFQALVASTDITAECFVCPSSNDEKAPGDTPQAIAAAWAAGGHLSYLYNGRGLTTTTATAQTIVAYEPPGNHDSDGGNALFGDGHVEFFNRQQLQKIVPATSPATTPVH